MSVEGVTHFTKTNSEFLALNVWEKEYDRFMKMRRVSVPIIDLEPCYYALRSG